MVSKKKTGKSTSLSKKHRYIIFATFLFIMVAWFMYWALTIPSGGMIGGPDEHMRILIPNYIFNHGALPDGYEMEARLAGTYWSYAFYPQQLGAVMSAAFMYIASIFTSNPWWLLVSARMTSVFFGVVSVLFAGMTIKTLLHKHKHVVLYSYIGMILLAAWPQFAFLTGYVNNDIIAFAGATVILYACISGVVNKWGYRNSLWFAAGAIICLLGYSNSYGFVLAGSIAWLVTVLMQKQEWRKVLKLGGVTAAVVLAAVMPFLMNNYMDYNGDVLGMSTFRERNDQWEGVCDCDMQSTYSEVKGVSSWHIVSDKEYRETQIDSYVARFGAMSVTPAREQLTIYKLFALAGIVGIIVSIVQFVRYRRRSEPSQLIVVYGAMIVAALITVMLSLYYTISVDYQPQGRYIIYTLVPIVTLGFVGAVTMLDQLIVKKYRVWFMILYTILYVATTGLIVYEAWVPVARQLF